MIRKIGNILFFTFEFILAFITLYFTVFFGGGLIPIGELHDTGDYTIYVQTNGVHTDICMPTQTNLFDWESHVPIADFPAAKGFEYISIGWGDKGFFLDTPTWADLTFTTAFNAALLPSGTAMHVAYLNEEPVISDTKAKVFINAVEYQKLIKFITESFSTKSNEIELIANRGYWNNDNFYEAKGNYHLLNTCNAWTNEALKIAGIKTGIFALSSNGIMSHFKN